jgi:hypothetical protein
MDLFEDGQRRAGRNTFSSTPARPKLSSETFLGHQTHRNLVRAIQRRETRPVKHGPRKPSALRDQARDGISTSLRTLLALGIRSRPHTFGHRLTPHTAGSSFTLLLCHPTLRLLHHYFFTRLNPQNRRSRICRRQLT